MLGRARLDDVELAFEIAGDGDRVVWCHGLASCRDGDRDIIESFVSAGFEVLSYDARGHGDSSPVREPERMNYPLLAKDLNGLLGHVGWDRAVLCGASMGAATAGRTAAVWPRRARGLVVTRPAASDEAGIGAPDWLKLVFAGGAHAIRTGGIDGAIEYLRSIPLAREALETDPTRVDGLRQDWERHDPLSIAAALDGIPRMGPLEDGVPASNIVCPTLVVPGTDVIHPTDAAHRVAAAIPGARLVPPYDDLPRDQQVMTLTKILREFVDGLD